MKEITYIVVTRGRGHIFGKHNFIGVDEETKRKTCKEKNKSLFEVLDEQHAYWRDVGICSCGELVIMEWVGYR